MMEVDYCRFSFSCLLFFSLVILFFYLSYYSVDRLCGCDKRLFQVSVLSVMFVCETNDSEWCFAVLCRSCDYMHVCVCVQFQVFCLSVALLHCVQSRIHSHYKLLVCRLL